MGGDDKLSPGPASLHLSLICAALEKGSIPVLPLRQNSPVLSRCPVQPVPLELIPNLALCTPFPGPAECQAAVLAARMAPGGTQSWQRAGTEVAITHRVALAGVENCSGLLCWDILAGHRAQASPGCRVEGTATLQLRGEQGKETTKLSAGKDCW